MFDEKNLVKYEINALNGFWIHERISLLSSTFPPKTSV